MEKPYGCKLPRKFYLQDTLEIARGLLGKYLVHEDAQGMTIGKIVETEAYLGKDDPASHAFGGKKTERTEVQFKVGGHVYVYLIYGMYNCFNIVTEKEGEPKSVFVRALEPIAGQDLMRDRRGITDESVDGLVELTNGPGKLCMAMDIDTSMSGKDLCEDEIFVTYPKDEDHMKIVSSERINIDYAGEAKRWPWRFFIKDNSFVSSSE